MKRFLKSAVSFLLVIVTFAIPSKVLAQDVEFPDPYGFVNDYAGVLSNDEVLEQDLREFARQESTEIFIITIEDLPEGVTIDNFVPRLTDSNPKWKAGQGEYDNGVIVTLVINSRDLRIDTGYGLEGALTDIETAQIRENEMNPYFADGEFDQGMANGVAAIQDAVKGEYEGTGTSYGSSDAADFGEIGFMCCFGFVFFVVPYVGGFLGRTKSWWLGGVLGLILGLFIGVFVAIFVTTLGALRFAGIILFPLFLTPIGLLYDFILSKNYKRRKKKGLSTGWAKSWGGFASGISSGGFSSGSSGGFSGGGGGSFGGGGSSGKW